jgi:GNAT superfamily N-acetyltransferase
MILETFNDKTITSKQHNSLTNLSQLASMLDDPAAKNYDIVDWHHKNDTLLYAFFNKKRFDVFNILHHNGTPIAMSGAYVFNHVPIIGVRTFTHPDYRGGGHWCQARHILPAQIDYYENLGYKKVWLTFNSYNKKLINFLKRMSEGKASHMGGGPKTIYKNLKWYDEPQVIQYTDQIIAELIIEDYKKCLT